MIEQPSSSTSKISPELSSEISFFAEKNNRKKINSSKGKIKISKKEISKNSSNPEKDFEKLNSEIKQVTENGKDLSYGSNSGRSKLVEQYNEQFLDSKYWGNNDNSKSSNKDDTEKKEIYKKKIEEFKLGRAKFEQKNNTKNENVPKRRIRIKIPKPSLLVRTKKINEKKQLEKEKLLQSIQNKINNVGRDSQASNESNDKNKDDNKKLLKINNNNKNDSDSDKESVIEVDDEFGEAEEIDKNNLNNNNKINKLTSINITNSNINFNNNRHLRCLTEHENNNTSNNISNENDEYFSLANNLNNNNNTNPYSYRLLTQMNNHTTHINLNSGKDSFISTNYSSNKIKKDDEHFSLSIEDDMKESEKQKLSRNYIKNNEIFKTMGLNNLNSYASNFSLNSINSLPYSTTARNNNSFVMTTMPQTNLNMLYYAKIQQPYDNYNSNPNTSYNKNLYKATTNNIINPAPASKHATTQKGQKINLNLEGIAKGTDKTTTVMIRNIPIKYTDELLLDSLDEFKGKFNCLYMPFDFNQNGNRGYAFINFVNPLHILYFYEKFNNKKWDFFDSPKICELNVANFQGTAEIQKHAKNYKGPKTPSFILGLEPNQNVIIPLKYLPIIKKRFPKMMYTEIKNKKAFLVKSF